MIYAEFIIKIWYIIEIFQSLPWEIPKYMQIMTAISFLHRICSKTESISQNKEKVTKKPTNV